jgi:hypothetical protein
MYSLDHAQEQKKRQEKMEEIAEYISNLDEGDIHDLIHEVAMRSPNVEKMIDIKIAADCAIQALHVMNELQVSDIKLGCHTHSKLFTINDSLDTQFFATIRAVNAVKNHKDTEVFVIQISNALVVVHQSEADIKEEKTLISTNDNGGWRKL